MKRRTMILALAIVAIIAVSTAYWYYTTATQPLVGTIEIDGSSTVYPITAAVAEEFEKSHPDVKTYTASGIHRKDNSWLFVIGDETNIYIFSTKYLRMIVEQKNYRLVEKPTSRGYLMPLSEAEKYCIRKIDLASAPGG